MSTQRGHGEGSIFKSPDGRWIAMLEIPSVDGRRHRKKLSGKTRKEVSAKLGAARSDLAAGVVIDHRLTGGLTSGGREPPCAQ